MNHTDAIALAAAGAAVINHVLDRGIDASMRRTQARPLPTGHLKPTQALCLALTLTVGSMLLLFRYSIAYLMWLFLALLLDHYLPTTQRP
ncbi:MAG: UbiA family prenyltransferase [Steroidobacteraceae bacterium]